MPYSTVARRTRRRPGSELSRGLVLPPWLAGSLSPYGAAGRYHQRWDSVSAANLRLAAVDRPDRLDRPALPPIRWQTSIRWQRDGAPRSL